MAAMKKTELDAITAKRDFIASNLDVIQVMTKLHAKGLLTDDDEELIKHQVTRRQKAEELLTRLKQQPDAFFPFLEILMSENKAFIAEEINTYYKDHKGEKPVNTKATQAILNKYGWRQDVTAIVHEEPRPVKSKKEEEEEITDPSP